MFKNAVCGANSTPSSVNSVTLTAQGENAAQFFLWLYFLSQTFHYHYLQIQIYITNINRHSCHTTYFLQLHFFTEYSTVRLLLPDLYIIIVPIVLLLLLF